MKLEIKKFKPKKSNIVVVVKDQPNQLKSGLWIPEVRHKDKYRQGTVIAVGPDVKNLKGGVMVIFNEYTGTKNIFPDDPNKIFYLFMKEEDVWAEYSGDVEIMELPTEGDHE